MRKLPPLRFRQVHLDFHTGPWIGDVGRDFNSRDFARTMKEAHVDSVTVFAKCHHGQLYYDTRRPERHPGLAPGLDLLGDQIEALHRLDIRAPIYISVQCDEFAADNHPEWIARTVDGKPVGAGPLGPGWQILDMSSPYQEYLAEQTREVLERFHPVDGIFYDMCWNQPSLNNYFVDAMLARGLDPESEAERFNYSREVSLAYMKRFYSMIKGVNPAASVYFNSRPLVAEEARFYDQVEIEALPSGGWGYMYFPKYVRYVRTFGRPYLGMTARFHKGWADFGGIKPYAALEYETSQIMAHGGRCSIGDQLHPRGVPDKAAYRLIGQVYRRVEEREPWLDGAVSAAQIGVFRVPASAGTDEGATRMLTQLRHQFDVVEPFVELEKYELLVLPDAVVLDDALARRLAAYVKRGGKLLASGTSGFSADGDKLVLPALGVVPHGKSPFTTTYIRFGREIGADVPETDHVMYERGLRVTARAGSRVVARVVEPYFERTWRHFSSHYQTPPARVSRWAAAVLRSNTAYVAYPIFSAFGTHGNYPYRLLVRNLLNHLLPDPMLRVDGPTSLEATVARQKARTIVHLLHYAPERRTPTLDIIEDVVPLFHVPVSLRLAKAPRKAYLAPERLPLNFEYENGRVNLLLPELRGHAMIVFE